MTRARRLVLLLDGTWNEDGSHDQDTNVVRLRDAITKSIADQSRVRRLLKRSIKTTMQ
jgi:uncharacterized protein (DUF2235 family)